MPIHNNDIWSGTEMQPRSTLQQLLASFLPAKPYEARVVPSQMNRLQAVRPEEPGRLPAQPMPVPNTPPPGQGTFGWPQVGPPSIYAGRPADPNYAVLGPGSPTPSPHFEGSGYVAPTNSPHFQGSGYYPATADDGAWPTASGAVDIHAGPGGVPPTAIDIHDTGPMPTPNPHAWANKPAVDPVVTGAVPTPAARPAAAAAAAAPAVDDKSLGGLFAALLSGGPGRMPSGVHMSRNYDPSRIRDVEDNLYTY